MSLVSYQFVGMTDQSLDTRAPAARVRERRHARPLRSDPPGRRHRRRCHRCQMERTQQKTPRVALENGDSQNSPKTPKTQTTQGKPKTREHAPNPPRPQTLTCLEPIYFLTDILGRQDKFESSNRYRLSFALTRALTALSLTSLLVYSRVSSPSPSRSVRVYA